MVVDFPAPFGPRKPKTSPSSTLHGQVFQRFFLLQVQEPVRVFLREILDLNRTLWHTHILEKPPHVVNGRRRDMFAICNSGKQKWRPMSGAPSATLPFDSGSVFSVTVAVNLPPTLRSAPDRSSPAPPSGIGFSVCGDRQLSRIPTCCTQLTVHRGAQPLCVRYSRWRISAV